MQPTLESIASSHPAPYCAALPCMSSFRSAAAASLQQLPVLVEQSHGRRICADVAPGTCRHTRRQGRSAHWISPCTTHSSTRMHTSNTRAYEAHFGTALPRNLSSSVTRTALVTAVPFLWHPDNCKMLTTGPNFVHCPCDMLCPTTTNLPN